MQSNAVVSQSVRQSVDASKKEEEEKKKGKKEDQ
jgi:hypothetical protein